MEHSTLKPFTGELDKVPANGLKPFTGTLDGEDPKRSTLDYAKDAAAWLVKGAIAVPEAAVGAADLVSGGRAGKALENEGGSFGLRFKQAREAVNEWHSDATKEAQRKFQEAEGLGGKFKAAIENPSNIVGAVVESLPAMGAGGVAARGLLSATRLGQAGAKGAAAAGALGEGIVGTGSAAEQIRQETEDGLLTPGQTAAGLATGVATAGLGYAGGRVAQRLGIGDADTMLAQGNQGIAKQFADEAATAAANPLVQQRAVKSIPRQVIEGAISEGLLEELPQSVSEQILQNLALGKDWAQDVDTAVVLGTLSGAAMGGGAAGYHAMKAPQATGSTADAVSANAADPALSDSAAPQGLPDVATYGTAIEQMVQPQAQPQYQEAHARALDESLPPDERQAAANSLHQAFNPDLFRQATQNASEQPPVPQAAAGIDPAPQSTPANGVTSQEQQAAATATEPLGGEITQSTGAASVPPSRAMGLDPAAGTLSAAAVLAVDSGAAAHAQQVTALAQAAQQAAKAPAKKDQAAHQTVQAPSKPPAGVNTDTGEVEPAARAAQVQERLDYLAQQGRAQGWSKAAVTERNALRDELAQLQPSSVSPTTNGALNGTQAAQTLAPSAQSSQAARAQGAPAAGPANAKGLTDGTGPTPNPGAQAAAATGPQAQAQGQAVAQHIDAAGAAWTRMPAAERKALAERIEGLKPVLRNGLPGAQWKNLNVDLQRKLADAMQPQGAAPAAATAAAPAPTAGEQQAQAVAAEGNEGRRAKMLAASERWASMPVVERQAVAKAAKGLNAPARAGAHARAWADLAPKVREKLAAAMSNAAAAPAARKVPALVDELGSGVGTYAEKLKVRTADAKQKLQQASSLSPTLQKANGYDVQALDAEVARLESLTGDARALDEAAVREEAGRGLLQGARQELDVSQLTPAQRSDVVARAAATGNAADASIAILDAVDSAASAAATSPTNDLPEPTEAQKEAGNYRKGHVRLNGLDISIENPAGSRRRPEWPPLQNHYGYIKGSMGADKDHVDVFLTDRAHESELPVFVVDQVNRDGSFDEHKVVMGAANEADARATYLGNYEKGWTGLGAITQMTQDEFRAWVRDPFKTKKPAGMLPGAKPGSAPKAAPVQRGQAAASQPAVQGEFANNKLFTADKVAAARERMRKKLGTLNSGIDPELLVDGMTIAGAYIESGVRSFTQYAKAMIDDMGDGVKPYLLSFWEGARNYPGLDTKGMTDPAESARQHQELLTPEVRTAAPEIGQAVEKPAKRTRKTGARGDMTLTQDWGVEHINGYGDETRETGNATKDAFLKEAQQYLQAVAADLAAAGFEPHADRKGKPGKPVSVNESGMAGSGDVTLTMHHPESSTHIYVHVGDSALRGMFPSTASGIAVMARVSQAQGDTYATRGQNRWLPVDVSATDLAGLVLAEARVKMQSQTRTTQSKESNHGNPEQTGRAANQSGAPEVSGRGSRDYDSAARADSGDLEGQQSQDVPAPENTGRSGGHGIRLPDADVGGIRPASQGRDADDGRPGAGRARASDAGAGGRSAADGGQRGGQLDSPATGAGRRADSAAARGSVETPKEVSPAHPGPGNFHIDNPLEIVGGGQVARFDKNQAAIELLNAIRESGRQATAEEQRTLAGYTGWGSFGQELFQGTWDKPMPKPGWEARDRWLRDHLGQDEWQSAQRSITNAHYTDPPTVMAMWDMVQRMGFSGGRVLEPSMGIGNFFGMMPADIKGRSQLAGIELDRLTGSMAQLLYPDANVKIMGYQESKTPDGFYDVVIGNWPFENTVIADRRYNTLSPFLHDYFFLKALDQVRAGGLVVGITSSGTMDKKATKIRAALARKAELVTAIRLPSGAFQEYAGTKVVTDIVILQKRAQPLSITPNVPWIQSVAYKTPAGPEVFINEFYAQNPGNVIGTTDYGHGTTRMQPGMIVHRPDNMAERLREAVKLVPEGVYARDDRAQHISYIANHTADREGSLTEQGGQLFVVRGEHLAPAQEVRNYTLKSATETAKREQQLRALIDMRRKYAALIEAERTGSADTQRTALRQAFESYEAAHGPLVQSFGMAYLDRLDDPFYPALAALTVNGRPSAILRESTMRGVHSIQNPTPQDAYVVARNRSVQPTLDEIAQIAGKPAEQVREVLVKSGAVFEAPNGDVVPSDLYLSGNVRQKLREAQAALDDGNKAMERNVQALKSVVPADIPYFNIESQLGATWVPAGTYAEYVAHMLNRSNPNGIEVTFINGRWKVRLPAEANHAPEAKTGFGTAEYPFSKLVNAAFSNQTVKIRRKDSDGNEYLDTTATDEVNSRISEMRSRFGEWLWSDPERRAALEGEYNEVRNAYATPRYDGSFLTFEGMALSLGRGPFNLRQHQVNAIWRALVNRRSINAHEVGTGKTFTMGGIAVESRRYGIAKKPLLLAHNANSASVAHEIQMMYPAAKVLYVDNMAGDAIAVRMRQIANDDWDAIVLPHSLIDRLSFREETLMAMAKDDIQSLEEEAYAAAEEDGVTLESKMLNDEEELKKLRSVTAKELVKARNRIIETIKKQSQRSSREGAIPFEDLGIDMVLVDEAHEFKKPPISTRMHMKGLNTETSNRSISLQFITRYIRTNNFGGNVHTFTGTPITNTLTEIFHQMRYVMEDEMREAGVDSWDGWFGSFAKEVQDVELSAAGEYEAINRLAGFINVPELRRMIGQYMDVVFADDMPEMQPRKVNGKTLASAGLTEAERAELLNGRTEDAADRPYKKVVNVTSDLTPEQSRIFAQLQVYAKQWRNMSGKQRMQAMRSGSPESPIITEGLANKASFDVRLTEDERWAGMEGQAPDDPGSKASKVVANVLEVYRSDARAAQVIFSDIGYSTSQKRSIGRNEAGDKLYRTVKTFSTMRDIVERLVQGGIPREQIAIVDGSTSKDKRKEIADAMNALTVRVVIGSTDTLGVGVNMQHNLRAMHHMDAPYMPGELEQRNGRGLRQGNQWNTVLEYRYMTDRLDGRRWQILAIKQRFITAFMKANSESRVIEGDAASDEENDILQSFSEAAGDPRILIRAKLRKNVDALLRAERMHGNGVADARSTLRSTREAIEWNRGVLQAMKAGNLPGRLQALMAAQADNFQMTVQGTVYDTRKDAEAAVAQFMGSEMRMEQSGIAVGSYRDQPVTARWSALSNVPELVMEVGGQEFSSPTLRGLEQQVRNYPSRIEKVEANVAQRQASIERLEEVSKAPFARAADLESAQKRLQALEKDIEFNPVPPPAWLRAGAPVDSEAFRAGSAFVVTGHRWTKDGWFVLGQDAKGEMAVPYLEVKDAQGMPVYEEREFQAPEVLEKEAPAVTAAPVAAAAPAETASSAAFRRADDGPGLTDDQMADLLRIMRPEPAEFSDAARAQAVSRVRATVDAIRAGWANGPEVIVAYDMDDPAVPAAARRADLRQRSRGATGAPEGFYWRGKAYLLASKLNTPADAARVLHHEVLGHHGLRGLFGRDLDQILNQVATMRQAEVDAKIKDYGLRGVALGRRTAAEEVLAEMAEKTPQLHFVRRAVAAIRNWLRAHVPGLKSWKMSDADIIQAYILPARDFVQRGQGAAAERMEPTFSRGASDPAEAFASEVRTAIAAGLADDKNALRVQVPVGIETPAVLQMLGVARKPVMTNRDLIAKMHFEHGVTRSELVRLGDLLSNPVMVFKSESKDGRFVVVTNLVNNGRPVIVAVEPNGKTNNTEVVYLPSAYPKDNADSVFSKWIKQGLLQYADKQQSRQLATNARLQLPGVVQRAVGFKAEYKTEADLAQSPDDDLMFSRSRLSDIKASALEQLQQTLSHEGKVSWWDKTIGTMRHLAERAPAFKPVYETAQRNIDDVSMLANDAADRAPRLLPRVDTLGDLIGKNRKTPVAAADNKAVARPLFEGTLTWARDVDGQPMQVDDLAKKYANLPADDKAQLMLRAGRLDDRILRAWRGLPLAQYEANVNSRFERKMLKAGVVWTDAELKSMFGATAGQIALYREARAAIDRSIDMTARADMMRALGDDYAGMRDMVLDAPTLADAMQLLTETLQQDARAKPDMAERLLQLNNMVVDRAAQARELQEDGYAPLSRFGRYTLDVVDAHGERQYFGMYETMRESNLAKLQMAQAFPGAKITQGTMSQQSYKLFAGITPETLEIFKDMVVGTEADAATRKVFDEYLKLTKNNHSALKRLIQRKGIEGYSQDVGRVVANFIYSNSRQAAAGLNAGTMDRAINNIPKEQGELKDLAMGLRDYIRDPQEEGQAVRGMLFAQYLGGSLASAMVNMTQPFAVTMPWLSQFGGMRAAGAQMTRAMNDMRRAWRDKGFRYESDLAMALQSAEDDGVVSPQEVHQLMAQARGAGGLRSGDGTRAGDARAAAANAWERTKVAWGQPFALAEQFNRRSTFIAAFRIAKAQGMADPGAFARKAVLETQFVYSKANKPKWARGAVGGTLFTFKTYSVSYLELMQRMWTQGGPEGRRAVGWALAMLLLMGGAGGVPFMEDIEDLIDGIGQMMGYNISAKQWRRQVLTNAVGKELAEFMEQGISGLPGAPIDISGRLGMGNLIPGTGLLLTKQDRERDLMEVAGPAGDLVARGFSGARDIFKGVVNLDADMAARGAMEWTPTAVRNAFKGADMATSGMYKDAKGYKVIDTTLGEAVAKFAGFQPRSVAQVQEANSFMQRSKSFYTLTSSEIKAQWADALFRKDDDALARVRERLQDWNRDNPDQPIVVRMPDVWKKVREMGKDRTDRIADTAPKALRAQMREMASSM
ncbi:PLxRFG domain-containing protein [Delftia sp. PS-11]|uniref:PLxRFG domain-containing protein n=1 Tax=Delftia sp. PS-11 TaxID=2767222 RepID=UPI002453CBCF|nr:PLxRFG domain-containing protein [Delftia sp. PS-11]KAJ8741824.1 PLxRFG domain-containing protein [Delftia sp. PS-11]